MKSSYIENNYGEVFETLIKCFRYPLAVELGVLDGYSTIHIAKALHINKLRWNVHGRLDSYDLWEDYPYRHGTMQDVQKEIEKAGVSDFINLYKGDAFKVADIYQDRSIHFLHVDISNTGDVLKRIMEVWDKKIYQGGMIVIEGGSEERDNVEWMIKYNKVPIKPELESNLIIKKNYVYGTYNAFPSLTVIYKKFDYA
ncbi:MAG TPA: class I SAM-dependent methyltransferase [Candidatus Omnitrophica bacterium]|nr:class I SAM-dependent methyltransferase [Candidatus Omnitrophota bacterium]